MARSRYTITEPDKPHFLTCTIVEWQPLFTRPELVGILLDAWRYQQNEQGMQLFGYVILENHLHYVAQAQDLAVAFAASNPSPRDGSSIIWRGATQSVCLSDYALRNVRIRQTGFIRSGRKAPTQRSSGVKA